MTRPDIIPLYTYEDYKLWKGDWELIAGHPVSMSSSSIKKHQKVSGNIHFQLKRSLMEKGDCEVLYEIDWIVSDKYVVRPDIVVVCEEDEDDFIQKAPSLIVEVLSPSTKEKDINTKYNLYESEGVQYYLIIDPDHSTIEVYMNGVNGYILIESINNQYTFDLKDNCTLKIDLSGIFI